MYCPANQELKLYAMEYAVTAKWNMPTAEDNSGKMPTVTCDQDSGSQLKIGHTDVTCTAHDASGNKEVCIFVINVIGEDKLWTKS